MFRCEQCRSISQPGEKQCTLVIEKRATTYTFYLIKTHSRDRETPVWKATKPVEQEGTRIVKTRTTQGWEIAREIKVCRKCLPKGESYA